MTFERPIFLLGLALALLPGAMYLSRYVRSKKETFPAAYFVFGRDPGPLKRLRLRQMIVALVRACLVAALALAFAGPMGHPTSLASDIQPRTGLVVVLDPSASMSTLREDSTAFEHSIALARKRLKELPESAQVMVLTSAAEIPASSRWVNPIRAMATLDAAEIQWGEYPLVSLVGQVLGEVQRTVPVLVYSDFRFTEQDGHKLGSLGDEYPNLTLIPVSGEKRNLGLTSPHSSAGRLSFAIQNRRGETGTVTLSMRCSAWSRSWDIELSGDVVQPLSVVPSKEAQSGDCVLRLPPDAFAADDAIWFTLEGGKRHRVLVVDGAPAGGGFQNAAFHMASALRAAGKPLAVYTLSQHEFSFQRLAMTDMLVLVDPVPLPPYMERAILSFASAGGVVWIVAGPQMARWPSDSLLLPGATFRECATLEQHPFRIEWLSREDPWTRGLSLLPDSQVGDWTSLRHTAVSLPAAGTQVLARFSDGVPVWLRIPTASIASGLSTSAEHPAERGARDLLLWTAAPDPANGQGGYHPLFPLAVFSFLDATFPDRADLRVPPACGAQMSCTQQALNPGDTLTGGMTGTASLKVGESGQLLCPEPGPFYRSITGGKQLVLQCFAPSSQHASVAASLPEDKPAQPMPAPPAPTRDGTDFTPWFMLAAVAFLMVELWLVSSRG